jgi:hypothetical protein
VNSTYTGVIYANAELDFYPTSANDPAPTVPDQVVPIYSNGDAYTFYSPSSPLTESITLPANTTQLYLDLIAQTDEFWWLSTPDATVAPYVQGVDATALREMDVSIDGTPAGVAPNHPYIFTGGVDPDLWIPIPGAETLNLKPYRVNLTPFAGVFDDGKAHTITIDDINTQGSSLVNGNLLVYTDHGAATVTGGIVSNTLTANPGTTVSSNADLDGGGNGTAQVEESLQRSFTISGYVNTSQGKVTTTVAETVNFANSQQLTNNAQTYILIDDLTSTVDSTVTTTNASGTSTAVTHTSNPLQFAINEGVNTDGSIDQTSTADLRDVFQQTGPGTYGLDQQEEVSGTDTLNFDSGGNFLGNTGMGSVGTYFSNDSLGNTYSSTLTASGNVLTGVTTGSSSSAVTLLLSAGPATAVQGATVTLGATVTPSNSSQAPSGYVTFYANGTALGTVGLASKSASLTVTSLPVGADAITASYSGDANFNAVNGLNTVTVTVTALAPTFTLGAPTPGTLPVVAGLTGVLTLPITTNATFSGTVTFSCSGMPAEASCQVNPGTLALTPGQSSSVSVVVATTAPNSNAAAENRMPGLKTLAGGGVSLAGLMLLMLPRRRRGAWKLVAVLLFVGFGLAGMTALTGCGNSGSGPTYPGTPTGTSTLTVTATSGSVTQTATFTVTVTQ